MPLARINLTALRHNFLALAERVAPKHVLAVVKWDAYGHGLAACVRVLDQAGAWGFGVSSPAEGIALRKSGVTKPILVMTDWVGKPIRHLLDYDLACAATSWYKVEYLESVSKQLGAPISTHLKFDTGLGRVGIHCSQYDSTLREVAKLKHLRLDAIYSHLAYGGPQHRERGLEQIRLFNDIIRFAQSVGVSPPITHLANSAAALALPEVPGTLVRTGIALYGQPPSPSVAGLLPLEPVMTLSAPILNARRIKKGHGFPAPHFYRAPFDGWGIEIDLGFSAGYPRSIVGHAKILYRGTRFPLVGVMSRDRSYALVTGDKPEPGEEVVFWGKQKESSLYLYELSPLIDALPYELTTWLSPKVPREFSD
ncbi:MAG: alanine racemase [bacterium]|nr:alanine racemase [bacterium]